jgi:hypothetical protein
MKWIEHLTFLIAIIPACGAVWFGLAVRWGYLDLNSLAGTIAGIMIPTGVALSLALYAYCETMRKR